MINKYDIILLSETWISDKHILNLEINDFESFHIYGQKTRGVKKGCQSGGISIYYKKELKEHISVIEKNDFGIVWLKISSNIFHFNEDVFICFSYIPPVTSKVLRDRDFDFFEEIEKGLEKYSKMGKTYIVGDLNSRTAQESDILDFDKYLDDIQKDEDDDDFLNDYLNSIYTRNNKDHVVDSNCHKLLNLCKSTDHVIANGRLYQDQDGEFTFCCQRGLSVTDYLLIHLFDVNTLKNFEILKWNNFSDYAALIVCFPTKYSEKSKTNIPHEIKYEEKIFFEESKINEFKHNLNHNIHNFDTHFDAEPDVTKQIQGLNDFLAENSREDFVKRVPVQQKKYNSHVNAPKWFNEQCYTTKQEFKQARNAFMKNKTDDHRKAFSKSRTKYNRARQKAKKNFKLNEGKKLENIAKTQPRKFWKSLKKCNNNLKNTDNDIKLDDLYKHFDELYGDNANNENDDLDFHDIQDNELDTEITEQELRRAVFKQNNGKSPGPDKIPAEIIKASYEHIAPYLLKTYNKLFQNADYPENWGQGYIVPIFKGGDPKLAKNYRGITLNNILAKIYSQILLNRLTAWSDKHEKYLNANLVIRKEKAQQTAYLYYTQSFQKY